MNPLVITTSALLIITKLYDCLSTLARIKGVTHESNPFARRLMLRYGIKTTVWLVFVVTIVAVVLSHAFVWWKDSALYQSLYIGIGMFISLVQFAVARANMSDSDNAITRLVRVYLKIIYGKRF